MLSCAPCPPGHQLVKDGNLNVGCTPCYDEYVNNLLPQLNSACCADGCPDGLPSTCPTECGRILGQFDDLCGAWIHGDIPDAADPATQVPITVVICLGLASQSDERTQIACA